jgi:hypothetical protein
MEHSEEYYKMKYFKYKAKYELELARQRGGVIVSDQYNQQDNQQGDQEKSSSIFTTIGNTFKKGYESIQKSKKNSDEEARNKFIQNQQILVKLVKEIIARQKKIDSNFNPSFTRFTDLENVIKVLLVNDEEKKTLNDLYKVCQGAKGTIVCQFEN